jgi:hypothetical protein
MARCKQAVCASLLLLANATAGASGPRWVTGQPYFTTSGQAVVWYTNAPRYFTDPGDLSASVDHAAANSLVAAAASVWNVPTSALTLAQGGELAEHVSGEDTYIGPNGPVFPTDVSSANYAAIQIPVIYDSDGSITDLLLGQGASGPENCQQNGVTESVDSIVPAGKIQHALLILNGRCSGPAPEQQFQLQYQLERAFGRVLGLAWSQTNDNVFTGTPQPTANDIANWPIMHPVDVVCGPYTYQCLTSPFTLRLDDVASISQLYSIAKGTAPPGKVDTLSNASSINGIMQFGGGQYLYTQGMQGMNLLIRRKNPGSAYTEPSAVVSAVTGTLFRWNNGNPVTGTPAATVAASMGSTNQQLQGGFNLGAIPIIPGIPLQDVIFTSEPINPLYTGEYGIGPYPSATVSPSGPAFPWQDNGVVPYESNYYVWSVPGSAPECAASGLGPKSAPLPFAASGWWTDVLCGYGVSAWQTVTVQAGRNLSIEATALDEQGLVTETKLEPLIGVWQQTDPINTLPTVAATESPFNSIAAGLTLLNFDTQQAGPLRLAITDERGDGRPDFGFRARVLYADSISPNMTTVDGGLILIIGMGFRPGNQVTVDGVAATVVSSTTNTILALAPPFAALPSGTGLTVDVDVLDPATGGVAAIYGGLTYPASALPAQTPQVLVLTPAFYVAASQQVTLTPVVGLSNAGAAATGMTVAWSSLSPSLTFAKGGQSTSDSNGLASIAATAGPLVGGAQAAGSACAFANICGSFTVFGVDPSLWVLTAVEGQAQAIPSTGILQPVVIQVTDGAGHPVVGAPLTLYQTVSGWVDCPAQGRCPVAPVYQASQASAVSDTNGLVVVTPQQLTGTPQVTTIAAAAGTQGFVSVPLQKHP